MKLLKHLTLAFMLLAFCPVSQAQTGDLNIFLGKLKTYASTHQANNIQTMPVIKPTDNQVKMPAPTIVGYMEDAETRLRYFPETGKVYDSETNFSFDI